MTVTELIELRSRIKGLSHVAFRGGPSFVTMSGIGEARRLQGMHVGPGAFDVLGVKPLLGRTFGASEEAPGAEPVMLLAHDTWQRQFNGDPNVVGRTVVLANALGGPAKPTTHTIVGVMPRGFEFPDAQMQFWTPVPWMPRSGGSLIARLADDVSMPAAAAELETLLREIKSERRPAAFELRRVQDSIVAPVRPALLVLTVAAGFVLLIACANVANLLLARTAVRQRELAIRTAIGAGRGRLVRQLLTESIMLALLGGAAGTMLAVGGVRLLRGLGTTLNRMDLGVQLMFPRLGEVGVDGAVLAVTLATTLATGLLFGLAPALLHSDQRQMDVLRAGATADGSGFGTRLRGGSGTARARLRGLLVIAEVALAMILLIGGGLLLHSLREADLDRARLPRGERPHLPGRVARHALSRRSGSHVRRRSHDAPARGARRPSRRVRAATAARGPHRERVLSTHARTPGAVRTRQSRTAPRQPRLPLRHGHAHRPGPWPDRG